MFAIPTNFTDIDKVNVELSQGQSYVGNFNILTGDGDKNIVISGYTPADTNGIFSDVAGFAADGSLTNAYVYFYLKDANQGNDKWDINVSIYDLLAGDGTLKGVSSSTQFDALSGAAFTLLNNNGVISYTVQNTGKNNGAKFVLEFARLSASGSSSVPPNPVPLVPDSGSTVALLGLALPGLAVLRRKFALI